MKLIIDVTKSKLKQYQIDDMIAACQDGTVNIEGEYIRHLLFLFYDYVMEDGGDLHEFHINDFIDALTKS